MDPLDFKLLDLAVAVPHADENGDVEGLAAGVEKGGFGGGSYGCLAVVYPVSQRKIPA